MKENVVAELERCFLLSALKEKIYSRAPAANPRVTRQLDNMTNLSITYPDEA